MRKCCSLSGQRRGCGRKAGHEGRSGRRPQRAAVRRAGAGAARRAARAAASFLRRADLSRAVCCCLAAVSAAMISRAIRSVTSARVSRTGAGASAFVKLMGNSFHGWVASAAIALHLPRKAVSPCPIRTGRQAGSNLARRAGGPQVRDGLAQPPVHNLRAHFGCGTAAPLRLAARRGRHDERRRS